MKIAIFTSHPIQYQAPFFRRLARERNIDFRVFFNWDFGVGKEQYDPGFDRKIVWDTPLLGGYDHKFLKNLSWNPGSSRFFGEINPGAVWEIWRGGYDAIVVYHWNYVTSWLIFLSAFLARVPVIVRGENPLSQEFFKAAWKLKLKKWLYGWLFGRMAAFLYIGEENRKFYEYYGVPKRKLFFSPYAVDNAAFEAAAKELAPKRAKLKKKFGIPEDSSVILFVGKLIQKKRPMELLVAYAALRDPRAALLFVGDGVQRTELERYAKEKNVPNVHFAGFRNYSEMKESYAIADVLVLPSGEGETWGLVANEAMCFGVPIIVSDLVGCGPDLVRGNGYTFPLGDVAALVGRLKEFFSDARHRSEFGARSMERVREYSYDKDIDGLRAALAGINRT